MTITEAADFLGVSASTLRNWDRAGKLKAARNPMSGYQLYRREGIQALLARAQDQATRKGRR
jgi:excisionase family DNA binding protein